jgi:hypothetical protein
VDHVKRQSIPIGPTGGQIDPDLPRCWARDLQTAFKIVPCGLETIGGRDRRLISFQEASQMYEAGRAKSPGRRTEIIASDHILHTVAVVPEKRWFCPACVVYSSSDLELRLRRSPVGTIGGGRQFDCCFPPMYSVYFPAQNLDTSIGKMGFSTNLPFDKSWRFKSRHNVPI